MDEAAYSEWAATHRTAFCLPDWWIEAAAEWLGVFDSLAATADELHEATEQIKRGDVQPEYPSYHLPAVKAMLGRVRNRARARATPADDPGRSVCVQCGDTRFVTVPHPHPLSIVGGVWVPTHDNRSGEPVYRTAGVTCTCYRGRALHDSLQGTKRPPLSLDKYELIVCPDWRQQMAAVEQARRERHRIEATTAEARTLPRRLAAGEGAG